jgi:CRP-like cAMP-binding protein
MTSTNPPAADNPRKNQLLAALPVACFEDISPGLEAAPMVLGHVLYEPGQQLQHAYFPTTAVVSLHYVMESGASAESAGVGNDGVVGISLFMGGDTVPSAAVVQTAGLAYRIGRRQLKEAFMRLAPLRAILLRYTQSLMTQTMQNAACYRHHSVEQQLCRWLLLTLDRGPPRDLVMTHELVASMLGVRRGGISEAAGILQAAGLIQYRRGHISVTEREGLEARACECYRVVRNESARLLATV